MLNGCVARSLSVVSSLSVRYVLISTSDEDTDAISDSVVPEGCGWSVQSSSVIP